MRRLPSQTIARLLAGCALASAATFTLPASSAHAQSGDPLVAVVDELIAAGRCPEARALMRHARLSPSGRAGRTAICDARQGRPDDAIAGVASALRHPNDPWVRAHRAELFDALALASGAPREVTPPAPVVASLPAPVVASLPAPVVASAPRPEVAPLTPATPAPASAPVAEASTNALAAGEASGRCPRGTVSVNPYLDWEASRVGACIPVADASAVPVSVVETNPYRMPESSQPASRPQRTRSNGSADKARPELHGLSRARDARAGG